MSVGLAAVQLIVWARFAAENLEELWSCLAVRAGNVSCITPFVANVNVLRCLGSGH